MLVCLREHFCPSRLVLRCFFSIGRDEAVEDYSALKCKEQLVTWHCSRNFWFSLPVALTVLKLQAAHVMPLLVAIVAETAGWVTITLSLHDMFDANWHLTGLMIVPQSRHICTASITCKCAKSSQAYSLGVCVGNELQQLRKVILASEDKALDATQARPCG